MIKKIENKIVLIYLILLLIDPGGQMFHLKIPLFIICIFIALRIKKTKKTLVLILILILIQILSLYISKINIGNYIILNNSYQRIGTIVFLSVMIFLNHKIKVSLLFVKSINFLSFFSIFIFIFYKLFPNLFFILYKSENIRQIFHVTTRTYGNFNYSTIYLGTSEIIVYNIWYYFFKEKTKYNNMFFLNLLALILSGTRMNIFISLILLILYYINKNKFLFISIFMPLTLWIFIKNNLFLTIMNMFSGTDGSNSRKLGYFIKYGEHFSNLKTILFGQGISSSFSIFKITTELTYLELFRVYGFLLGLIMFFILFLPLLNIKKINQNNKYIYYSYLTYFLMNLINPSLFTSQGMILFSIAIYSFYLDSNYQKEVLA